MGFKAIRIALTYLSLTITTNFATQIYMEKVLVNNESPPPLINFVWLFLFVDVIINIVLVLVMVLMGKLGALGPLQNIYSEYLVDYGICMVFTLIFGMITAQVMYNKKYFLYKDDGLRAVRALSEMIFYMSIVINVIPFGIIEKVFFSAVTKPEMSIKDLITASTTLKELTGDDRSSSFELAKEALRNRR